MNATPLRVLRTVASAFFGVRRKADSERDLEHLSIKQIVFVAVVVMAVFVTTILLIVKTVIG
jgi:predicted exporter